MHDIVARPCRIYLEESLRTNDAFTDQLEDDVADMRTIMGLGTREAADIRSEIVSKSYKCAQNHQYLAIRAVSIDVLVKRHGNVCVCSWRNCFACSIVSTVNAAYSLYCALCHWCLRVTQSPCKEFCGA